MTDLKSLLEQAAGGEPAVTDQDLAADLSRGKRSARRRGAVTITAGVAATALVIGGGWTLLPDTKPSGTSIAATPTVHPSGQTEAAERAARERRLRPTPGRPVVQPTGVPLPPETIRPPARPKDPVPLVRDGVRRAGMNIVCDLKPKGWVVKVYRGQGGGWAGGDIAWWSDPNQKPVHDGFSYLKVRPEVFAQEENGEKIVPKYSNGWDYFPHYQAGPYEAVINHYRNKQRVPLSANGERQIHMKVDENRLIDVSAMPPHLGWDVRTALKFAGSCHPVS